jgi:hypothetical protein
MPLVGAWSFDNYISQGLKLLSGTVSYGSRFQTSGTGQS